MRPFPQPQDDVSSMDLAELWERHRKDMIAPTGIDIFLFGNKKSKDGEVVDANGVKLEYDIANRDGRLLLPVPSTGWMAKKLFDEHREAIIKDFHLSESDLSQLESNADPVELSELILKIVDSVAGV